MSALKSVAVLVFLFTLNCSAQQISCQDGVPLNAEEKKNLIEKLRISNAGKNLLESFTSKYKQFEKLKINWGASSYSQTAPDHVCIYLTHILPEIEHIADLAHELVHATRLSPHVLYGQMSSASEFVSNRIQAKGGEAEAFAVECEVKYEILGQWDSLCSPFVSENNSKKIDQQKVIRGLYEGQLSASLTGETYPVMLSRQYKAISKKKSLRRPASE